MKDTRIAPAQSGLRAFPHHTVPEVKRCASQALRVLIVPGLGGSGADHWQSWLQRQYARAVRVEQTDPDTPDLDAWADRIGTTLAKHPRTHWIAAAHSFGVLALAHFIQRQQALGKDPGICASLLVAPADPDKFGVAERLAVTPRLSIRSRVVGSSSDPWMSEDKAQHWAQAWGSAYTGLGNVGHINVDSGHGPWLLGRFFVDQFIRAQHHRDRIALESAVFYNTPN